MGEAELMRAAVPRQIRDRVLPVKVLQRPGWEPGDSYAVLQLSDLAVMVRAARPLWERTGLAPLDSRSALCVTRTATRRESGTQTAS